MQILGRAIRTDCYRLVEWKGFNAAAETAEFELYDYRADPLEAKNLASEQPQVVEELRKLLAKHPEAKPQVPAEPAKPSASTPPKSDRHELFDSNDKTKTRGHARS